MSAIVVMAFSAEARANSTLAVVGNACEIDPGFRTQTKVRSAVGRLTVTNISGTALHVEEDVVATSASVSQRGCLWQFDIHFTPELVEAVLAEELFVELELCVKSPGHHDDGEDDDGEDDDEPEHAWLRTRGVTSCAAGDPAVTIIAEPIDTLLDDVARAIVAVMEATCPEGTALRAIDLDGTPQYVCTEPLALAADLEAESQARAAEDAVLHGRIDGVADDLAAETAARTAADHLLAQGVATNAYEITVLAVVDADQQAQISANAGNIASNAAGISGLQAFDANLAGSCANGQAMAGIDASGNPICAPVGAQRVTSSLEEGTSTCSYSCSSTVGHPVCACSCSHGWFSSCSCSCSSTATASCSASSCSAPPVDAACPFVGGSQGQSVLSSCPPPSSGFAPPAYDSCTGTSATASGPATSCSSSRTRACSCSCGGWQRGSCSCACRPPGTASCTAPTHSATPAVSSRAICLSLQ